MSKSYHMALSVDVDRFSDRHLTRQYRGALRHRDGREVRVPGELRKLCADARAKGQSVLPPCDNVDASGHCRGHEEEDS